ncbi:hypothetical protein PFISCL1PPCAC_3577, partial [Pristionchus fissidentatus]
SAVCFLPQSETIPRRALALIPSTSLAFCKLSCIRKAECQSVTFNLNRKMCALHGNAIDQVCAGVTIYTRLVKTINGCPQPAPADLTSNYSPDLALASAIFTPLLLRTSTTGICPNLPVEGEATARPYVV